MKKNKHPKIYTLLGISFFILAITTYIFFSHKNFFIDKDFHYEADVISSDSFYDPGSEKYSQEFLSNSRFYYDLKSISSENAVIQNFFDVRKQNGDPIFNVIRNYTIDKNKGTHQETIDDREVYLFSPNLLSKKDVFLYRHVNYDAPIEMKYQETVSIDGLKLFHFQGSVSADQTDNLTYLPEVPEKRGIITEGVVDIWIEPSSGYLVKYKDSAIAWYYDQITTKKIHPWNSFSNHFTDLSESFHVNQAKAYKGKVILFVVLIPLFLSLIGLFFIFLRFRKSKKLKILMAKRNILFIPVTIFLLIMALTYFLFVSVNNNIKNDKTVLFEQETKLISTAINNRMELYLNALQSGTGLLDASGFVSRDEWRIFVDRLNIQDKFPGIQGYGYSIVVPAEEKQRHIESIRNEGFTDYTIRPEEEKDEYTSIIYLEPFDERNRQAFGLDMTFEENRRNAMHNARDTGEPYMSGRVILVQEIDEDVQAGFLLYVPYYNKLLPQTTVSERREALVGYVYAPFRMRDFMSGILQDRDQIIDFEIYDASPDEYTLDDLMYSNQRLGNDIDGEHFLQKKEIITIANHDWTIIYTPRIEFGLGILRESSAFIVLGIGFVLASILSFLAYILSSSRFRAITIAEKMTKTLRTESEKNKAILASIGDGLVVVDATGQIVLINNMFRELTGYSSGEVVGSPLIDVLDLVDFQGESVPKKERPLSIALQKGVSVNNNNNKVHEYVRKDGTRFPVAILISPIIIDGIFMGAVEVFRDITKEYEIDKAKTEFVSLASHQLRTPLTAISWYTEMLLTDNSDSLSSNQDMYIKEIQNGSNRMIHLVNSLLNVSRIELGTFAVESKEVNIKKILKDTLKDLQILIKDKNIQLNIIDENAPQIYIGDPNLLSIILQNLISNAFKYTLQGEITIRLDVSEKYFVMSVKDTGYGIPENQKEHIFKKLFRADNVKEQDTTGTGLGLYIVKAIVEQSGGHIDFTSKEGQGTTFKVCLPVDGMKSKKGSRPLQ